MIYEFRTYTLKPGGVPKFEEIFGEALPHREKYSKLAAFWHTEVGPLNQVIHVWGYDDAQQRSEIRAAAAQNPNWPPKASHLIVNMESEIVVPGPFQKPIEPGSYGPLYEMRYYDATPGSMPEIMEAFGAKLPDRRKHSDLFFAGSTDMGLLNKLIHIWPYNDMNHRTETRAAAVAAGDWPPAIGGTHCWDEYQIHAPVRLLACPVTHERHSS